MTLPEHAQNIRRNILEAGYKAGAMHFGGSLSLVEILTVLYGDVLRYDVNALSSMDRDRLVLSKGHGGLAIYAAMCEFGIISKDELLSVKSDGGEFPVQPKRNLAHGLEMSSGSLGLGLSFGIGQALAVIPRGDGSLPQVHVVVGNGEINEGAFWEAVMFAGAEGVDNVCVTVDDNGMQLDGTSAQVLPVMNWGERFAAFGWTVAESDGHDIASLSRGYRTPRNGKPLAVIAKTVKGNGVSFMENVPEWHHGKMTDEQFKIAMSENGGIQ